MKIKKHDYDNVIVLQLQGEFESDFAELFENEFLNVVSGKNRKIVLDMSEVDFIDSAGLSKFLWAKKTAKENKSQLRIASLSENCEKILELTGIKNEFNICGEIAEAVKSFV